MIQVTYQKRNGEVIRRTIYGYSPYKIGDTNSYGWEVTDVKYKYNDKFYSKREYDLLTNREWVRRRRILKWKNTFYNVYKELAYCVILLILLRFFEVTSKVFA